MREKALLVVIAGACGVSAWADSYIQTLDAICAQSSEIAVAEALTDASVKWSRTGLTLDDPEVEASYEWGNPCGVPNRTIISVTQGFDFAILSGAKKRVAEAESDMAEARLAGVKMNVRCNADELMTQMVYHTRLRVYYHDGLECYQSIVEGLEGAASLDNVNDAEVCAAKLAYQTFIAEMQLNEMELVNLDESLNAIAGGMTVRWMAEDYMPYVLSDDFDAWCSDAAWHSPVIAEVKAEKELANRMLSLTKTESLPSVSIGYTCELVRDNNYSGARVSVGIPLWAGRGKVKAAKAAKKAADLTAENAMQNFTSRQRSLYGKALVLRGMEARYRALCEEFDLSSGLEDIKNSSHLPVSELLDRLETLLEFKKRAIDTEYDYQMSLTALRNLRINH